MQVTHEKWRPGAPGVRRPNRMAKRHRDEMSIQTGENDQKPNSRFEEKKRKQKQKQKKKRKKSTVQSKKIKFRKREETKSKSSDAKSVRQK